MKGLNEAAFEVGDVLSYHGYGTSRRPGLPVQLREIVVADGMADRSEREVRRKARQ